MAFIDNYFSFVVNICADVEANVLLINNLIEIDYILTEERIMRC